MNALLEHITVILMQTAPTLKDHSIVLVIRDTLGMESLAMVSCTHCLGGGGGGVMFECLID